MAGLSVRPLAAALLLVSVGCEKIADIAMGRGISESESAWKDRQQVESYRDAYATPGRTEAEAIALFTKIYHRPPNLTEPLAPMSTGESGTGE